MKNFLIKNLLSTLLLVLPLSAGINFVQQNSKTIAPSSSSVVVAYPAGQTAGNLNIVVVGWNDTRAAVKSVSDSRGNNYVLGVGPSAGTALTQSIYYATNIAAGSNTVTVTFNRKAAYPDVRVLEYSGLDSKAPLDVTAAAAGNSQNADSGPATTTALSELIFGAGMTLGGYSAAGSGFTKRVITNFGDIAEDTTVLAMGRYSATAPLTSSTQWLMQMAAFRGSGQSSPLPPQVTAITPNSGSTDGGTSVTITGTGFSAGVSVQLGATAATNVVAASSTTITATTPAHIAGTVDVVATNPDGQSGALPGGYTYTTSSGPSPEPPPVVTAIAPNSGPADGGTSVMITGTGFASGATVTFGGIAATNVSVGSSTSITATTPAHTAGTVDVVVKNTDNQTGTLSGSYTYTSSTGGGNIAYVQSNSGPATIQASNTAVAVTYVATQTAGDTNIVVIGWGDTTSTISSVTDNKLNSYQLAVGPTSGTGLRQAIYYAPNIAGGSTTVTVTFNQAASYPDVRILEYSGLDPSAPFDKAVGAAGTGTAANSGSVSTTAASELIFGAGTSGTNFTAAGTGFTSRMINLYGNIAEDKTVNATGTYNATATEASGTWVMQVATFRAGGQSPPPPPPNPPPPAGHSYTTNFPLTENPISEGGNWVNGGPDALGVDWSDVFTGANGAHGEETPGTPSTHASGAAFSDATAVLQGGGLTWAQNQAVTATVFASGTTQTCGQEVEIRLNTTIAANSITGYEISSSVSNGSTFIVRWNGAVGSFTILAQATGLTSKNGDRLQASRNGSTITVSINGVQRLSVDDTTFTGGSPGMGFNYTQNPGCVQSTESLKYGFSSFAASDSGVAP